MQVPPIPDKDPSSIPLPLFLHRDTMGLLWWRKPSSSSSSSSSSLQPVPGMNGAVEVPLRPTGIDVVVFEFGSVANSTDKVTLAGYCPVSDELEPCRWFVVPAKEDNAPQFRVAF